MAITRVTKPPASYHQFAASGLNVNDFIGVSESLGGRPANSVTIESPGAQSKVKFNAITQVRKTHRFDNSWIQDAAFWTKPGVVSEFENTNADEIVIQADTIHTWTKDEVAIDNIKIVELGSNLRITIT